MVVIDHSKKGYLLDLLFQITLM